MYVPEMFILFCNLEMKILLLFLFCIKIIDYIFFIIFIWITASYLFMSYQSFHSS